MASAFEYYLRTGRRPIEIQTKFNPWHDPDDGRFTFANQGRYFPGRRARHGRTGGGFAAGGSFGGGGASGRWAGSGGGGAATGSGQLRLEGRSTAAQPTSNASPPTPQRRVNRTSREPRLTVRKNGYEFSIDAHARTRRVSGEIGLQQQPRSRSAQANAGEPDRRPSDHGGHFIATRFNGPREWFNHFAQDANFNQGAYRTLEDQWAGAVRSGKRVFVDIVPHYRGTSMRPYKLIVTWIVDGKESLREFGNEKQGR
jgi:hypothetical protein